MGVIGFLAGMAVGSALTSVLSKEVNKNLKECNKEFKMALSNEAMLKHEAYKIIDQWNREGILPEKMNEVYREIAEFELRRSQLQNPNPGNAMFGYGR